MPKTLIKPRLFSNKFKRNPEPQTENFESELPQDLQKIRQKILSGKGVF